jgi:hypothetical protein
LNANPDNNELALIGSIGSPNEIIVMKVDQQFKSFAPCLEGFSNNILTSQDVAASLETMNYRLNSGTVTVTDGNVIINEKNLIGRSCNPEADIVYFNSPGYSVNENENFAIITVNLSRVSNNEVTVNYETCDLNFSCMGFQPSLGLPIPGKDYVSTSGQLLFAPGEQSKQFEIAIINNDEYKMDRGLVISLSVDASSNVFLGNPNKTLLTIVEDDPAPQVSFSQAAYTVTKDEILAVIEVVSDRPSGTGFPIWYSTADGTALAGRDYLTSSEQIYFSQGDLTQSLTVAILNPPDQYATRNLTLALEASGNAYLLGSPAVATLTILGPTRIILRPVWPLPPTQTASR